MRPRGMAFAVDAPTLLMGMVRLGDVVAVVVSGVASFGLREGTLDLPGIYLVGIVLGGLLTANVMHLGGAYRLRSLDQPGINMGQLLAGWLGVMLGLIVLAYFSKTSVEFSRVWVVLWATTSFALMALVRIAAHWQRARWRRQGRLRIRLAIVGAPELAAQLARHFAAHPDEQFEIVGLYDDRTPPADAQAACHPPSGTLADLIGQFRQAPADEIVIALPWRESGRIATLLKTLKPLPANVRLCPEAFGMEFPSRGFGDLGGIPMLGIFERPLSGWSLILKALEDRLLAGMALLLALPLMALIAVGIKLDSRGPVLFAQRRYGFNNNEFPVYKFRTMAAETCRTGDTRQASRNDPRVTRFGAFLRRTSLDELPQLFNVLKGDMSLVGPRPHAVAHNEQFAKIIDDYLSRHRVKPGITGWAQVNGLRGEVDNPRKMQLRVQYDLYYIDNWSLAFDLRILLLTLAVGFIHRNAY